MTHWPVANHHIRTIPTRLRQREILNAQLAQ
jgi:hypothetical protein